MDGEAVMAESVKGKERPNSVDVVICGRALNLIGDEEPEYFRALARYVNKKRDEIAAAKRSSGPYNQQLLIAVNAADDYFKERERRQRAESQLSRGLSALEIVKAENDGLIAERAELARQIAELKAELAAAGANTVRPLPKPEPPEPPVGANIVRPLPEPEPDVYNKNAYVKRKPNHRRGGR